MHVKQCLHFWISSLAFGFSPGINGITFGLQVALLCEMKAGSFSTGPKIISPRVLIKQCLHLKSGLLIGN